MPVAQRQKALDPLELDSQKILKPGIRNWAQDPFTTATTSSQRGISLSSKGKFYFFLLMKEENQGAGQFEWWKCVYWLADTQLVFIVYLR